MESNTEFHQLAWCPLSLHKTQIDPVATPTEAVDFWHRAPQNRAASLFTLNETAPIYWESNVFGLVTGSVIHNGHLDFGGSVDNQYEYGVTAIESPNLSDGTEGVTVSYDDTVTRSAPPGNNPAPLFALNGRGRLKLKLRRQISSQGNLRGEYSHNWSVGGKSWDPSNISLNIGTPVSYDLPTLADNWVLDDKQDI